MKPIPPVSTFCPTGRKEWYSRGYLPHRDRVHLLQCITFRLADSLPASVILQMERELAMLPPDRRNQQKRKKVEQWMDAGKGCCVLGTPQVAEFVQNSLLHFDRQRYRLLAWVIMPNHVHVVVDPLISMAQMVQAWKSHTSRWMLAQNHSLSLGFGDSRRVWMREYHDRFIRDEDHLHAAIRYVHQNPVKAGLCREPQDWAWSSARLNGTPTSPSA
jgi:putative transposase